MRFIVKFLLKADDLVSSRKKSIHYQTLRLKQHGNDEREENELTKISAGQDEIDKGSFLFILATIRANIAGHGG